MYLSDGDVQGGELRSFPQASCVQGRCGAYEKDLQIGWLKTPEVAAVRPVFLDCWRGTSSFTRSALFIVNTNGRQYITDDFDLRDPGTGTPRDLDYNRELRVPGSFHLIEDQELWARGEIPVGSSAVDIAPLPGTLVMFDSVALPHEVLAVTKGQRIALAGWFHEKQQEFPEWALF